MRNLLIFFIFVSGATVLPDRGVALATPVPDIRPAAPEFFAVLVGQNRPLDTALPSLKYADDDAVRQQRWMSTLGRTVLLTEPDASTRAALSKVPYLRPTVANLRETFRATLARAKKARRAEIVFYYAGHGVVKNDRAFLTLADGPLTQKMLEVMLLRPAQQHGITVHLILDACRAFSFVGRGSDEGRRERRAALPRTNLASRYPNVGFVTATTETAETHEAAKYRGGVFSHVLRSGMSGLADINNDQRVTYGELAAFAETAYKKIKNYAYRPRVWFEPPDGDLETAVVNLSRSSAARVVVPAQFAGRYQVRGQQNQPLVDFHSPAGSAVTVWLPPDDDYLFVRLHVAGEAPGGKKAELPPNNPERAGRVRQTYGVSLGQNQRQPLVLGDGQRLAMRGDESWNPFHKVFAVPFTREVFVEEVARFGTPEARASIWKIICTPVAVSQKVLSGLHLGLGYNATFDLIEERPMSHGPRLELMVPLLRGNMGLGSNVSYGHYDSDQDGTYRETWDQLYLALAVEYRGLSWRLFRAGDGAGVLRLVAGLDLALGMFWVTKVNESSEFSPAFRYQGYAGLEFDLPWKLYIRARGALGQIIKDDSILANSDGDPIGQAGFTVAVGYHH